MTTNPSVELVVFAGEEILDMLRQAMPDETTITQEHTVQVTEGPVFQFNTFNQPVAVVCGEGEVKRWYIGFYMDDNDDGTFRVDHLIRAGNGDEIWHRPPGCDDIQDTTEQQIVPVAVSRVSTG